MKKHVVNIVSKLLFYTEDVIQMYAENDIQGLKEMFNIIKTNYELNPQDKKLFFKMSIYFLNIIAGIKGY